MAPTSLGLSVAQREVQQGPTRSKQSLLVFGTLRFLAGLGLAQGTTITGLNTQDRPGTPTTVLVAGGSTFGGHSLTLNYAGGTRSVSSYLAGPDTFEAVQVASLITLRRNLSQSTPTNNIVWNSITSFSGTTYNLAGPFIGQEAAAFGGVNLNLFVGSDNVFGHRGDRNGNNNNIERIDSVFTASGITANNTLSLAVFERGSLKGHDGFKIAAITAVDANGNPSAYGPLVNIPAGQWGTTNLGTLNSLVTRNNANQPGADATHPSARTGGQFLGGISINVIQDLGILPGEKIFGYSLFAPDVSANANLVDWNSFPTNTNSGSPGGLDPAAYNGVLYHLVPGNPGPVTVWTLPANGDYSTPGNWTQAAAPDITDTVVINNGTTATLTGNSSAANLEMGIGYSGADGNAALEGGNLTATGTVAIGVDGAADLSISKGGVVTDNAGTLGQNSGSNGSAEVTGPGSQWNSAGPLTVGEEGLGKIDVSMGGVIIAGTMTIGDQAGSTGAASVDGAGSEVNSAGVLTIGDAGSGTVAITNGGVVNAGTATIGDQAGSTGDVRVDGAGSQLNSAGALTIGDTGSGTVAITNGGVVNAGTTTIGDQAGSTGAVSVEGGSSQLNSAGVLTIGNLSSGTLAISNGGVVNAGTTMIGDQAGATGAVSVDGAGSQLNSPGVLTIGNVGSGTLAITNGGVVNAGTMTIGDQAGATGAVSVDGRGSRLNSAGDVAVGSAGLGTLVITNGGAVIDSNGTVGGPIGSSGSVSVDGSSSRWDSRGTLNLGFIGPGTLVVSNGGAVSAKEGMMVGPRGKLAGDGSITSPNLVNSGMVTPGGPNGTPGMLHVTGNYQQGPGGTLSIVVGGPQTSQAAQLNVSGSARLGGTLILSSVNNFHPTSGVTYQILTANAGLSGQFAQTIDTLDTVGLTRLTVYAPNGVLGTYLSSATPLPPTPGPPSGPPTLTLQTAGNLPATAMTNAQKNAFLVPLLDPSARQLSSLFEVWFSGADTQRSNLENRFDELVAGSSGFVSNLSYRKPPPTGKQEVEGKEVFGKTEAQEVVDAPLQPSLANRWGIWVTGFGDFVNVADGSAKGYDFTTGGVTFGMDYRVTDHLVVGLMGGCARTWTDLNPAGSVDVNAGWGGLYAGFFNQGFYVDGAVFGGHDSFESSRSGLLGAAKGSSTGLELSGFLAGGYDFHFGALTIGPIAAVQYTYASLEGFSESGSVAPLRVSSDSQDSLRTDFGFRAWYDFRAGLATFRPFVRAAWEHEFNYSGLPISASLVEIPGSPFTFFGPSLGHDSVVVSAGISAQWTTSFSTYVSYEGELGRDRYGSNGVSGGCRFAF